jgi:hypothetical protein
VDDAHREPAVLVVAYPFDTRIAQPHALPSNPLEPKVRMGGAEILSPLQSRVGKRSDRQSEESRVDLVGHLRLQRLLCMSIGPNRSCHAADSRC